MKTLCFTIVFASMIAIYTSVDSKSEYLVKISFIVPELTDAEVEAKVSHQLGSLNGVKQNNSDTDTGTVELVVDYSEFSIDDLKTSFDKSGWSYEDASIEDIY
tara:strand:- start:1480 stop:1788 length:309 start_codon:yes stop_codon:yes gene_type:complete